MFSVIHWGINADETYSKWLYDENKYQTACTWIEWLVSWFINSVQLKNIWKLQIHGFPWFVVATLGLIIAYGKNFSEMTQYGLVVLNLGKF